MVRWAFFASLPFPHSLLHQLLPPPRIFNAKTLFRSTPTCDFRARFYDACVQFDDDERLQTNTFRLEARLRLVQPSPR
ncbi:hypothetical protein C8R44DRAFT_767636 [Mycena epipterygia]|nr:hypothetical protein C8R44DRAFT_767636 [Mycena epipterygia]